VSLFYRTELTTDKVFVEENNCNGLEKHFIGTIKKEVQKKIHKIAGPRSTSPNQVWFC
jgi:hypothetical protein